MGGAQLEDSCSLLPFTSPASHGASAPDRRRGTRHIASRPRVPQAPTAGGSADSRIARSPTDGEIDGVVGAFDDRPLIGANRHDLETGAGDAEGARCHVEPGGLLSEPHDSCAAGAELRTARDCPARARRASVCTTADANMARA
jgi:hypothetical protein